MDDQKRYGSHVAKTKTQSSFKHCANSVCFFSAFFSNTENFWAPIHVH